MPKERTSLKLLNDALRQAKKERDYTQNTHGKWHPEGAKEKRLAEHDNEILELINDIVAIEKSIEFN